jgi:hypothetical protein
MCVIDDCGGKPVAKGLCAKHYARLRRGGDPQRLRKPGRKTPQDTALNRKFFPEWSPRTQARYTLAMRLLIRMGWSRPPKPRPAGTPASTSRSS